MDSGDYDVQLAKLREEVGELRTAMGLMFEVYGSKYEAMGRLARCIWEQMPGRKSQALDRMLTKMGIPRNRRVIKKGNK